MAAELLRKEVLFIKRQGQGKNVSSPELGGGGNLSGVLITILRRVFFEIPIKGSSCRSLYGICQGCPRTS